MYVTDELSVGLTSGIETERGLNHLILQVAVDSLRATNHLNAALFLQIVLSEHASIGVRVVTTNDNNGLDTEFLAHFDTVVELPSLFEFGTTGTDNIETTGVTVFVNNLGSQLLILTFNQTARTSEETVQFIGRIEAFEAIK